MLALVLPLTVIAASRGPPLAAYSARYYRDLTVMTIAGCNGEVARSFSADTGMGEALIVGVKRNEPTKANPAAMLGVYVNLRSAASTTAWMRPRSHALSKISRLPQALIRHR